MREIRSRIPGSEVREKREQVMEFEEYEQVMNFELTIPFKNSRRGGRQCAWAGCELIWCPL